MSLRIQALRQLQNSGHQNTKINNPGGQGLRLYVSMEEASPFHSTGIFKCIVLNNYQNRSLLKCIIECKQCNEKSVT